MDKKNEFRIRIGQSKIPYGFENMQSSQNRIPLDRNDALNSAIVNERDLSAIVYWAPQKTRALYSSLANDELKGSGDYGIFAFGVFNGQGSNRPELNNTLHVVAKAGYPFQIGNQILEPSIQAFKGKVELSSDIRTPGVKAANNFSFADERLAGTIMLYPKPFGILAEYTVGRGPEYQSPTDSILTKKLWGGYATFFYMLKSKNGMVWMPYSRIQAYNGGKKHEQDARSHSVREIETGIEWQINKNLELTTCFVTSKRRFEDFTLKNNLQKGSFMRIQVQVSL